MLAVSERWAVVQVLAADSNPAGAVFFGILMFGLPIAVAIDALRFSADEWAQVSMNPNGRWLYIFSPLLLFFCGAGLVYALFYLVRVGPRLRKARAGKLVRRTIGQRVSERVMLGNVSGALDSLEADLEGKLASGGKEFGLHISEATVGVGVFDGWSALIDSAVGLIQTRGCEVLSLNDTGHPGGRHLTIRVLNPQAATSS